MTDSPTDYAPTADGQPTSGHGLGRIQLGPAVTLGSVSTTSVLIMAAAAGLPGPG